MSGGDPGIGAAIGAGSGLLTGTASGAEAGRVYGWQAQRQYDIAYQQCMYAKGNQLPGAPRKAYNSRRMPPPPPGWTSSAEPGTMTDPPTE
jgi:hypothetical protein